MKNAMKKLTSLLLVALLLVGMIPFAASAASAGNWFDVFWTETNDGKSYVRCPILTDGSVDWSAVSNKVGSIDGFMDRLQGWNVEGVGTISSLSRDLTPQAIAMMANKSYNVFPILAAAPAPTTVTFYVDAANSTGVTTHTVNEWDKFGSILPSAPATGKLGYAFTGWYLDGNQVTADHQVRPEYAGKTITAGWYKVEGACTICGLTSGHAAGCAALNGSATTPAPEGSTGSSSESTNNSIMYVDVILTPNKTSGFTTGDYYRCNLVNGKITQEDRNAIANLIVGKNIGAWKRADNGTQAYSLVDFDFAGLKNAINILPVVNTTPSGSTGSTSSGTVSGTVTPVVNNKFPYNVYLNIYKDTKVGSPDKCIDITNGIALDGRVNVAEVKTVVANYYNANNNYGIGYDGLYLAQGNWVANYVADTQKYDTIEAKEMQQTGYVYINVMISNATAKSSYVADSSNPKTGDSIYTAMTVMGISAASLAAVMYLYNKKRQAV